VILSVYHHRRVAAQGDEDFLLIPLDLVVLWDRLSRR